MTAEQFAYWLQGFFEMSGPDVALTPAQAKMIREHLATVFQKVTPPLAPLQPEVIPLPYMPPSSPGHYPSPWREIDMFPKITCDTTIC